MKKNILVISLIVVIVLWGSAAAVSFATFGTANFIAASHGLYKVVFTDTELVAISENPTIVIGKPNANIDEYMMENGGYIVEADKQLGAMRVYNNGDSEVHIMYSANGYYAKWVWQD